MSESRFYHNVCFPIGRVQALKAAREGREEARGHSTSIWDDRYVGEKGLSQPQEGVPSGLEGA